MRAAKIATHRPTARLVLWAYLILVPGLMAGCGRSPVAGLQGEYCVADIDCEAGLVCDRNACVSPELIAPPGSERTSLFFTVLQLTQWAGEPDGQLPAFGQFVSDLSTVLTPYYAAEALDDSRLLFGRIDRLSDPLSLDAGQSVTSLELTQTPQARWLGLTDVLLIPLTYSDDNVTVDFDLPLRAAEITLVITPGTYGSVGVCSISGALSATDAANLDIIQSGDEFTLFDVLRNDPLTEDLNSDGILDGWLLTWQGTATIR